MRRRGQGRGRAIVPVLLLALAAGAGVVSLAPAPQDEDWASSPEAYFLTAEERAEWKALSSRESRHDFQERYWLKRDPSPGSEKNEFKDLVLARIKTADARFKIQSTPGSRTARGMVFIVLGTPARAVDAAAPKPPPETGGGRRLGVGVTPVASYEGNETSTTWYYESDRTPRILQAIGRPSLAITIFIEPSRRRDWVEDPGLFNDVKEIVARKSIVNPDLVPSGPPAEVFAAEVPAAPREALLPTVRAVLEAAAPASRGKDSFAGSACVFHETGAAEAVVWLAAAAPPRGAKFNGLVRSEDGREAASWTEPASASSVFSMLGNGAVFARRVSLPPGSYSASVALTDDTGKPLAASTLPVRVPGLEGTFAVSSLLLTAGPATAAATGDPLFVFGGVALPPRADAAFRSSQSLWYFVEVANPKDPSKVMLEPRLRRGGEQAGSLAPFPAKLQPIGKSRYIAGVELPLATLGAGDYVLYLGVRDGAGEGSSQELRRAEFRVLP